MGNIFSREIDNKYENGKTLLHIAVLNGNTDELKTLISNKAKIEPVDDYGQTPLSYAVQKGNKEAVSILLNNGANPNKLYDKIPLNSVENCISSKGYTLLHHAAKYNSGKEIIDLLLEKVKEPIKSINKTANLTIYQHSFKNSLNGYSQEHLRILTPLDMAAFRNNNQNEINLTKDHIIGLGGQTFGYLDNMRKTAEKAKNDTIEKAKYDKKMHKLDLEKKKLVSRRESNYEKYTKKQDRSKEKVGCFSCFTSPKVQHEMNI